MAIAGFKGGRIDRRQITRQKPAYEPETAKTIKHPAGSAKARVAAEFEATRQH